MHKFMHRKVTPNESTQELPTRHRYGDNFSGQLPYQTTYPNSFSFIGRGVAANTLEIDIVRLSINENGASTIIFENRILECK